MVAFPEKREAVSQFFPACPLCQKTTIVTQFCHDWFARDYIVCSNCHARWHLDFLARARLKWAELIEPDAEGKGREYLRTRREPAFWYDMIKEKPPKKVEVTRARVHLWKPWQIFLPSFCVALFALYVLWPREPLNPYASGGQSLATGLGILFAIFFTAGIIAGIITYIATGSQERKTEDTCGTCAFFGKLSCPGRESYDGARPCKLHKSTREAREVRN